MKVRIGYSVELDSVPEQASELVSECKKTLEEVVEDLNCAIHLLKSERFLEVSGEILDSTRKQMAIVDSTLAETHSMVTGLSDYYVAKQQEELQQLEEQLQPLAEPEPEPEPEPEQEAAPPDDRRPTRLWDSEAKMYRPREEP